MIPPQEQAGSAHHSSWLLYNLIPCRKGGYGSLKVSFSSRNCSYSAGMKTWFRYGSFTPLQAVVPHIRIVLGVTTVADDITLGDV